MIELLSLLNPGPEIVLYRFDIISPGILAGHLAFQFHLLLSPDEGVFLNHLPIHTSLIQDVKSQCNAVVKPPSSGLIEGYIFSEGPVR